MDFKPYLSNIFGRRKFVPDQMPKIQQPTYGPADSIMDFDLNKMAPKPSPFVPRSNLRLSTPAADEFGRYIGSMPERTNPNIWQKLAAAVGGASESYFKGPAAGIETAKNLRDAGYNRQLEDWGLGVEPRRIAAQLESQNLGRENSSERNQITDRYNQGRVEVGRMNAETARLKLSQGRFKLGAINENGNPILIDETSGKYQVLTDVDTYSPREKFEADLAASMARLDKQQAGANQRNAATIAGADRRTQAQIEAARERQQKEFDFKLDNPDLESEVRPNKAWEEYQDNNVNRELASLHPDWIGKILFIDQDNGRVFPVPPEQPSNRWSSNVEKSAAYKLYKQEYANLRRPKSSTRTGSKTKSSGLVELIGNDGKIYTANSDEVEQALATGQFRRK